jgi:hypothetical protein
MHNKYNYIAKQLRTLQHVIQVTRRGNRIILAYDAHQPANQAIQDKAVLAGNTQLQVISQKVKRTPLPALDTIPEEPDSIETEPEPDIIHTQASVALCLQMCPETETAFRIEIGGGAVSKFELDPHTGSVDPNRMIKAYERSGAGKDLRDPKIIRPPEVLKGVLDYIEDSILDRNERFLDIFSFVFDRTRAIRSDLDIQGDTSKTSVDIVERIARFHILAGYELCELSESQNTMKTLNSNQLSYCLITLGKYYSIHRASNEPCENECEFQSYRLLYLLNDNPYKCLQILRELQHIPHLMDSQFVKFAIQIFKCIRSENFLQFFELMKQGSLLQRMLLHKLFGYVRVKIATSLSHSCSKEKPFQLEKLLRMLGFDNVDQLNASNLRCVVNLASGECVWESAVSLEVTKKEFISNFCIGTYASRKEVVHSVEVVYEDSDEDLLRLQNLKKKIILAQRGFFITSIIDLLRLRTSYIHRDRSKLLKFAFLSRIIEQNQERLHRIRSLDSKMNIFMKNQRSSFFMHFKSIASMRSLYEKKCKIVYITSMIQRWKVMQRLVQSQADILNHLEQHSSAAPNFSVRLSYTSDVDRLAKLSVSEKYIYKEGDSSLEKCSVLLREFPHRNELLEHGDLSICVFTSSAFSHLRQLRRIFWTIMPSDSFRGTEEIWGKWSVQNSSQSCKGIIKHITQSSGLKGFQTMIFVCPYPITSTESRKNLAILDELISTLPEESMIPILILADGPSPPKVLEENMKQFFEPFILSKQSRVSHVSYQALFLSLEKGFLNEDGIKSSLEPLASRVHVIKAPVRISLIEKYSNFFRSLEKDSPANLVDGFNSYLNEVITSVSTVKLSYINWPLYSDVYFSHNEEEKSQIPHIDWNTTANLKRSASLLRSFFLPSLEIDVFSNHVQYMESIQRWVIACNFDQASETDIVHKLGQLWAFANIQDSRFQLILVEFMIYVLYERAKQIIDTLKLESFFEL